VTSKPGRGGKGPLRFRERSIAYCHGSRTLRWAWSAYNCASIHLRRTSVMRVLAPALMLQLYSPILSAAREESAQQPLEVETVSIVYVVLFGVAFIGMIVGFFVRLFMNEKKAGTEEK
jgi:hypothetical protein